jgi:hypothetical protein
MNLEESSSPFWLFGEILPWVDYGCAADTLEFTPFYLIGEAADKTVDHVELESSETES